LYFNLLARSYAEGDLSLVYPVARGMGPLIVPVLVVVFLSETIEPLAIGGIAAILGGIYTISWWGNFHQVLRRPLLFLSSAGMRYAMPIGLTIATYAIVDKEGIGHVQPLLYMYFFDRRVGPDPGGLHPGPERHRRSEDRVAGKRSANHGGRATDICRLRAGVDRFLLARASYVAPAWEVGIVIGVMMGVFLLKEPFGGGRLLGSGFIVGGLLLITLLL
tara:strand:+ start:255 stop:911 length:657 start_codon:yes stop_codon:yes gene_type:complete